MKHVQLLCIILTNVITAEAAFQIFRPLTNSVECPMVVRVMLDDHALTNTQPGFADLRIFNSKQCPVPCITGYARSAIWTEQHVHATTTIQELHTAPTGELTLTCVIKDNAPQFIDELMIHTPLKNFEHCVTVQTADSNGAWHPVKPAEPIYNYARYADVSKCSIRFSPALTQNTIRVIIHSSDDRVFSAYRHVQEELNSTSPNPHSFTRYQVEKRPFRIDAIEVIGRTHARYLNEDRSQKRICSDLSIVQSDKSQKKTYLFGDAHGLLCTGIQLNPKEETFERKVSVESFVEETWHLLAQTTISAMNLPGQKHHRFTVLNFPPRVLSRIRVSIENNDNPPLTFDPSLGVTLLSPPISTTFVAQPQEHYALVYGDETCSTPPIYEQNIVEYLEGESAHQTWQLPQAPAQQVHKTQIHAILRHLQNQSVPLAALFGMLILGVLIVNAVRRSQTEDTRV